MSAVQRLSPIQSTVDREPASPRKNFVFVCGLHRSGTTLITRCLAQHPMISTFANTGSIEDEGQFLQTVLPLERTFGGVGRFGFDVRAHMTETSELNTPDAASRLLSEWGRHWNMDKSVLLEKTPSNLLRMRLLARMFQPTAFVIVTRHPVATSLATLKWTEATAFSLISHWVHCYRIARSDAALLDRTLWLSYEAFVRRPQEELARLVQFLGLPPRSDWSLALRDDNEAYFELWRTRFFAESDRSIEQIYPRTGDYQAGEPETLVVDESVPVSELGSIITLNWPDALRECFVVTSAGRYLGIGTSEALVKCKIEILAAREAQLNAALSQAQDASRAKSNFLALMSHELRTPLNAIIGFSQVLSTELFGPHSVPRYREYAVDIHGAGTHLLELISHILDLSKTEAGKLELY